MNERRRDRRIATDLPTVLKVGKKPLQGTTTNVSFHGLSVRLDDAPPLRQLVQVELELPTGKSFSAHAMVVHAGAGFVGLEFFGRSNNPDWDDFVQGAGKGATNPSLAAPAVGGPAAHQPLGAAVSPQTNPSMGVQGQGPSYPPPAPTRPSVVPGLAPVGPSAPPPRPYDGPERRRAPRIGMKLELRLRTPRSIHTAYTVSVSMIGATLAVSELQGQLGETVIVNLIQPGTNFSFRRDGIIRRVTPIDATWCHAGVEFAALEPMREVLFAEFMNTAFAALQSTGGR